LTPFVPAVGKSELTLSTPPATTIEITVLLFGQAREFANTGTIEIQIDQPATVERVFAQLKLSHPKLAQLERSLLFAVNEEYADRSQSLSDRDRLAILPPVSGGSDTDIFEVTREPIDTMGLRRRLITGASGAIVVFDGVARDNTKGRRTRYLEYEGYDEMALKTMSQIGQEVHERWPINNIGVIHRLGRIETTESSVVIIVTSAHRKVAFEACHYAIDRLKKIVPIWKKEYFEDGEVWIENTE
jgi:molybdopterin synthase catalytic subunit